MMHVECPWCAAETTVDVDETFECAICAVRVEIAWEPAAADIAQAA